MPSPLSLSDPVQRHGTGAAARGLPATCPLCSRPGRWTAVQWNCTLYVARHALCVAAAHLDQPGQPSVQPVGQQDSPVVPGTHCDGQDLQLGSAHGCLKILHRDVLPPGDCTQHRLVAQASEHKVCGVSMLLRRLPGTPETSCTEPLSRGRGGRPEACALAASCLMVQPAGSTSATSAPTERFCASCLIVHSTASRTCCKVLGDGIHSLQSSLQDCMGMAHSAAHHVLLGQRRPPGASCRAWKRSEGDVLGGRQEPD